MSEASSSPKAPRPQHQRTHDVLRMSSPELIKQALRRQTESSTSKHRPASIDSCGVADCRHSYTLSLSPVVTRRVDHSVDPRQRIEGGEKVAERKKAARNSHKVHGVGKVNTQGRSRRDISVRLRSQVRNSSARPPTSHLPHSRMTSHLPSSYHGSPAPRSSTEHFKFQQRSGFSPASTNMPWGFYVYHQRRRAVSPTWTHRAESYHENRSGKEIRDRKTHSHTKRERKNRLTRPSSTGETSMRAGLLDGSDTYRGRSTSREPSPLPGRQTASISSSVVGTHRPGSTTTIYASARQSPVSETYSVVPSALPSDLSVRNSFSCERSVKSPSAPPTSSHASSAPSSHTSASSSIPWSTLEKHAHCRKSKCPLRRQLDAKLSHHRSPSPPTKFQTALPARSPRCTCPIYVNVEGEQLPPEHEETTEHFKKPLLSILEDGVLYLRDPLKGVYYHLSPTSPSQPSSLEIQDSGDFDFEAPDEKQGFNCPCYDEIHGLGAAAKVVCELKEMERLEDVLWSSKEALLEKFPWIERDRVEERVRDDFYWLGEQYLRVFNLEGGRKMVVVAKLLDESGLLEGN